MTDQLRAAAQQALEALEIFQAAGQWTRQSNNAITALRAALAQQAEPVQFDSAEARAAKAEAERDALLLALRNLRDYCARQGWLLRFKHSGVMDAARAAIAKAEGGGNG